MPETDKQGLLQLLQPRVIPKTFCIHVYFDFPPLTAIFNFDKLKREIKINT